VQSETTTGRNDNSLNTSEQPKRDKSESWVEETAESKDITAVSSRTADSSPLSAQVATEAATLESSGGEECGSARVKLLDDSGFVTECSLSEVAKDGVPETASASIDTSEVDLDCLVDHERPTPPGRRSVAIQTDAYESDDEDESSDDEEMSSTDAESDTSSVCSRDSLVASAASSPERSGDDVDAEENAVAESASCPEVAADAGSTCVESSSLSSKSEADNPDGACTCAGDSDTQRMPSPSRLPSADWKGENEPGLETSASESGQMSGVEEGVHLTEKSGFCDAATSPNANSGALAAVAEGSPLQQNVVPDADQPFKMPGCSPDDVNRFAGDAYQSSSGAYSSPRSNYSGVLSDCSPPSCVQLPQTSLAGGGNSLGGGGANYNMPTPSPTNSSARSFNMASPSSYQQLASASQLDCFQMESAYQPYASLPASIAACQRPAENFPSHHQTVTPPMERVGAHCPSDYGGLSSHLNMGYQLSSGGGSPCIPPQMAGTGWPSLYVQQQQPVEFGPHRGGPGLVPDSRSNAADRRPRYGKNCVKNVTSMGVGGQNAAAPNVALHPGTNMITGYDIYASDYGDSRRGEFDYHRQMALGYPADYSADRSYMGVAANIYPYRQQAADGYQQSNHIHGSNQSLCPSAYGYVNRTLMGHSTFDMRQ